MELERSTETETESLMRVKLVLVGDSGVGKSTVLIRYVDDIYVPDSTMTVGVDWKIKVLEVHGSRVQVKIVDTAGQERFSSLAPMYCRNADVILAFYDISNQTSFEHVEYWLDKVGLPLEEMKVVLVGNKTDRDFDRVVSTGVGQAKASRLVPGGALFFETSAKTGENLDDLFERAVCCAMEKQGRGKFCCKQEVITLTNEKPENVNKKSRCCLSGTTAPVT